MSRSGPSGISTIPVVGLYPSSPDQETPHKGYVLPMPVIVVGADTAPGRAISKGLSSPEREVRLFVSNEAAGAAFKKAGFKVAIGDVSDESHVEAAATHCFTAVLITAAAHDGRERSFASSGREVAEQWATAVTNAAVKRVIWVTSEVPPSTDASETVTVDPNDADLVAKVVSLDEVQRIL